MADAPPRRRRQLDLDGRNHPLPVHPPLVHPSTLTVGLRDPVYTSAEVRGITSSALATVVLNSIEHRGPERRLLIYRDANSLADSIIRETLVASNFPPPSVNRAPNRADCNHPSEKTRLQVLEHCGIKSWWIIFRGNHLNGGRKLIV